MHPRIVAPAGWAPENFVEYMHLPSVHPALCDVSGVAEHKRAQGRGNTVSFVTSPVSRGGTPLDLDVVPSMPGLGPRNKQTAWFQLVFPNVFYFGFPHSWFVVILNPDSPRTTVEQAYLLMHEDSLAAPGTLLPCCTPLAAWKCPLTGVQRLVVPLHPQMRRRRSRPCGTSTTL